MKSSKTPPRIPDRAALALTALLLTVPTALKAQDESGARDMISKLEFVTPIIKGSGLWALSNRFKASFHEGFAFHARDVTRGDGGRVHWSTRSITAGGEPLTTEFGLRSKHSDWRCDYLHGGGIVESYDVSKAGVEQSFLIPKRPEKAGDLVVTGKITTGLKATPVLDQHTPIEFRDHTGQPVTGYGKAFVIDAGGRRGEVKTSFDGESLSLRVEGSWLEDAEFPIVIDPLFHTKVVFTVPAGSQHARLSIGMGQENVSKSHNLILAFTVLTYAPGTFTEEETHVVLCNRDFTQPKIVYTAYSDRRYIFDSIWGKVTPNSVAPVAAARKWVVAFGGYNSYIYVHEFANLTTSSGVIRQLPRFPHIKFGFGRPLLGGTSRGSTKDPNFRPGTKALIVIDAFQWFAVRGRGYVVFDAVKMNFTTDLIDLEVKRLGYSVATINQVNDGAISSPWIVSSRGKDAHVFHLIRPDGSFKMATVPDSDSVLTDGV